jgi:hypothetical protein
MMNKMLIAAAALTLAVSTVPALVGQAQAAPAKSPFCSMAPATTSASWAEYYGCWGGPPRAYDQYNQPVVQMRGRHHHHHHGLAPTPVVYTGPAPASTDFCKLAPAATSASWDEFYGCWKH